MRKWTLFSSAIALAIFAGAMPADAKKRVPPPPPPAAPLPPPFIAGVDGDALASVDRFNAARGQQPLWLANSMATPAAITLISRLKTADIDGYVQGPALATRIETSLASPLRLADADRALSGGYLMLVRALASPSKGLRYADPGARPTLYPDERLLAMAAQAPDLDSYLRRALRRSDLYESLRTAALASRAPDGAVEPRLKANLDRARLIPAAGRVLVVNPPAAEILMIENGQVRDRMRVVVGTPQTPTYPMASMLRAVTANPYWNVPSDLVKKIVAPRVASQGVSYLKRARYEVVDQFGPDAVVTPASDVDWKAVNDGKLQVQLRQLPGPYNSMGRMKFGFENDWGIYLHDTPNKAQFAEAERSHSNGCIRLEDAPRLARWLLGSDPSLAGDHGDQPVPIGQPVPIYVSYLTAQPGAAGMQWLPDVYGFDPKVLGAIAPPPAPKPIVETPVMVDPLAPTS